MNLTKRPGRAEEDGKAAGGQGKGEGGRGKGEAENEEGSYDTLLCASFEEERECGIEGRECRGRRKEIGGTAGGLVDFSGYRKADLLDACDSTFLAFSIFARFSSIR
ncbi:hypothetical protein KM043_012096 [Ampulex compressa]|nr:hypothetical protein KM043_012096 [Ampulex compressa]